MLPTVSSSDGGHRIVGIVACLLVVALPAVAAAELYKYERPDGSVLITTERRPDLELKGIVGGGGSGSGGTSSDDSNASDTEPEPSSESSASTSSTSRREPETTSTERLEQFSGDREDRFDDIIREASRAYDVPFSFIKAVVRVESNFKPDATSHAGAMGLMQLMPKTAQFLSVTEPYDPRQNIFGGTKLLRQLIDRYDGDINLILSAYNAGGAAVEAYNGIPYRETRRYVASVYKWYKRYSNTNRSDSNDDTEETE
jgi:hypothetical protein